MGGGGGGGGCNTFHALLLDSQRRHIMGQCIRLCFFGMHTIKLNGGGVAMDYRAYNFNISQFEKQKN